jgi:hypothetical protein
MVTQAEAEETKGLELSPLEVELGTSSRPLWPADADPKKHKRRQRCVPLLLCTLGLQESPKWSRRPRVETWTRREEEGDRARTDRGAGSGAADYASGDAAARGLGSSSWS